MTTITREQQKQILIDTANHVISRDNTSPYSENLRELARIALASLDAKPIYQYQSGIYNDDNGETDWYWDDCDAGFYKQYAADRRRIVYTAQPAPVAPEDWVMVPKEPTRQMMAQGHFAMKGTDRGKFRRIYQAMITAASALNKGEY
ncbi:hypothetical protein E2G76_00015 [Salmonella enterica subsp. enterica serovar Manhattan]|nr:hypothetical protein [Salmonella enterica subsp. enterica serovar Manhattan]